MRDAVVELDRRQVDFEYDGEMAADVALDPELMKRSTRSAACTGPANVLIMPALHAANICSQAAAAAGRRHGDRPAADRPLQAGPDRADGRHGRPTSSTWRRSRRTTRTSPRGDDETTTECGLGGCGPHPGCSDDDDDRHGATAHDRNARHCDAGRRLSGLRRRRRRGRSTRQDPSLAVRDAATPRAAPTTCRCSKRASSTSRWCRARWRTRRSPASAARPPISRSSPRCIPRRACSSCAPTARTAPSRICAASRSRSARTAPGLVILARYVLDGIGLDRERDFQAIYPRPRGRRPGHGAGRARRGAVGRRHRMAGVHGDGHRAGRRALHRARRGRDRAHPRQASLPAAARRCPPAAIPAQTRRSSRSARGASSWRGRRSPTTSPIASRVRCIAARRRWREAGAGARDDRRQHRRRGAPRADPPRRGALPTRDRRSLSGRQTRTVRRWAPPRSLQASENSSSAAWARFTPAAARSAPMKVFTTSHPASRCSRIRVIETRRVARLERREDLLVLPDRGVPADLLKDWPCSARAGHARIELPIGAGVGRVAVRRRDDRQVDGLVELEILHQLAAPIVGEHPIVLGRDVSTSASPLRADGGDLAGHGFQAPEHLDKSLRRRRLQRRQPGAAVGQKFDQTFGGQSLEGFAQRRARDAELRAELLLRHARPGGQSPSMTMSRRRDVTSSCIGARGGRLADIRGAACRATGEGAERLAIRFIA